MPSKDPNGPVKPHPPLDGVRGGALMKSSTCIISMFALWQRADTSRTPHQLSRNVFFFERELPLGYPGGVSFFPGITQLTAEAMWCSTGSWKCHWRRYPSLFCCQSWSAAAGVTNQGAVLSNDTRVEAESMWPDSLAEIAAFRFKLLWGVSTNPREEY